jgi:hypothetical protein
VVGASPPNRLIPPTPAPPTLLCFLHANIGTNPSGQGSGLAKKIGESAYRAVCPLKHRDFLLTNIIRSLSGQSFVGLHSRCICRFVSSGEESDKFFASPLPCPDGHGTKIIKNWCHLCVYSLKDIYFLRKHFFDSLVMRRLLHYAFITRN